MSFCNNFDLSRAIVLAGYMPPYPFRILDLPVELIVEIAVWAQLIWQREVLPMRVPDTEVHRLPAGNPRAVRRESCCRGLLREQVPCCMALWTPPATLAPARSMAQTCRRLRAVLLADNHRIWVHDNALYKRPGFPTDVNLSGAATAPVAENLIVQEACIHSIRPVKRLFPLVKNARLALPWDDPDALTRNVEEFFFLRHLMQSPLQHLDLEIYACSRAREQVIIRNVQIDSLHTYRALNSSLVCYSRNLTTMEISHPYTRRPHFDATFFEALSVCASSLQHLSIDAPRARFSGTGHIAMPELRYLRLVAQSSLDIPFLRALVLPATLDIHLEPAVNWRWEAFYLRDLPPLPRFAVPFADIEEQHGRSNDYPHELWRYMGALAAPDEIAGVFRKPAQFSVRDEGLWPTMTAMGLDVRLDPSSELFDRAAGRYPEYVNVSFASSAAEIVRMQDHPGHYGQHSASPHGKLTARRSLGVRDLNHRPSERASQLVPAMPAPLYDCIRYIMTTALRGKPGSPFLGTPSIRDFSLHPQSWLPTFTMGWEAIFDAVGATMERLEFGCRPSTPVYPLLSNSEGSLHKRHLDSFAQYLNDFADPLKCPCPCLKRVHVLFIPRDETPAGASARLEAQFNSPRRQNAGAPRIAFVFSDVWHEGFFETWCDRRAPAEDGAHL